MVDQWINQASVAVLNPTFGCEFIWRDIEKNERFTQALVEKLDEFWHESVLERIPPAPDASVSSARALAALCSASKDVTVEPPEQSAEWARELHEAQAQIREWEQVDDRGRVVFIVLGLLESDQVRAVNTQVSRAVV